MMKRRLSAEKEQEVYSLELKKIENAVRGSFPKPNNVVVIGSAPENLRKRTLISTLQATYVLTADPPRDRKTFSARGERRSDGLEIRLEFERASWERTGQGRLEKLARLGGMLSLDLDPSLVDHLHAPIDKGCHRPWNFLVMPTYRYTLEDFLRNSKKDEREPGTMLKIATHAFLGIRNLHHLGLVHGEIRPENIVIGAGRDSRRVLVANYGIVDERMNSTYCARARMNGLPASNKGDLESWAYMTAELFDRHLLPWHPKMLAPDQVSKEQLLALKRTFIKGKFWPAQQLLMFEEFRVILDMIYTLRKTTTTFSYDSVLNLLGSAAEYYKQPVFSTSPWDDNNVGMKVTPSKYVLKPVKTAIH